MRDKRKERIDYTPCPAAAELLAEAEILLPGISKQARLDRLVLYGVWAIHFQQTMPTVPPGSNRAYWRPPSRA